MKRYLYTLIMTLLILDSASGQAGFNIKRTLGETGHEIYSALYDQSGKYIVTTGSDLNIIVWNAEAGTIYRTLAGAKKIQKCVAFAPGSERLASGGDDNIISLWDIKLARTAASFDMKQGNVKALAISPDGNLLAAGGSDKTVKVWNLKDNRLLYDLKFHKGDINCLKFSPDGSMLASGAADKILVLWNLSNGSILKSRPVHNGWIRDISFNSDGSKIASCGDDNLVIVSSVPSIDPILTLRGHRQWVQSVDFSSDGKYLLSGGHDNEVILWDASSGKELTRSEKQEQIVVSARFCPFKDEFVSACLRSQNFNTWAISGPSSGKDEFMISGNEVVKEPLAEMKKEVVVAEKADYTKKSVISFDDEVIEGNLVKPAKSFAPPPPPAPLNLTADIPRIEVFSPSLMENVAVSDQSSLYLIGRISNAEGTSTILINKKPVRLSEAGVFELKMDLVKGDNPVDIIAVNNKGKMRELTANINCTSETALAENAGPSSDGKYYALLIGINNYTSPDISSLDKPIGDAQKLYDVLTSRYLFEKDNVILLKNPTLNEIITSLDGLVGRINPEDNLLIFYAGHGYWDEKGKVGYWFPSDATKNSTVNWFRNSTLRDFIGSIQSKHTLLIADACFSGAIFKTRSAFNDAPGGVQQLYDLPSRKAMTSGVLQVVPDESTFMKYLVEKLNSNNEKFLPSEILFGSLKTAVMNNSSNVPQYGVIQNVGDEGGDFIFVKR